MEKKPEIKPNGLNDCFYRVPCDIKHTGYCTDSDRENGLDDIPYHLEKAGNRIPDVLGNGFYAVHDAAEKTLDTVPDIHKEIFCTAPQVFP